MYHFGRLGTFILLSISLTAADVRGKTQPQRNFHSEYMALAHATSVKRREAWGPTV